MMEKYKGYRTKCDKCGVWFAGGTDFEFVVQETKKQMKENLIEQDWSVKGNKVLCDSCKEG